MRTASPSPTPARRLPRRRPCASTTTARPSRAVHRSIPSLLLGSLLFLVLLFSTLTPPTPNPKPQAPNPAAFTGAVIASDADPALNKLSTQTISYTDIQNHSEYDAKSVSITAGSSGVSGGMSHQSGDKTGLTQSAIAGGNITVRSDYDENGNPIRDSLSNLSRDTATANGSVENLFNPQDLATQQELAQVAGEVGFRAVGDLSKLVYDKQVSDLKKEVQAGDMTQEEYERRYQEINKTWDDGGTAKIILHTAVGAAQASLGGGDVLSGALGAGAAEAARNTSLSTAILGDSKWIRDENGNAITATGEAKAIDQLFSTAIGLGAGALAGDAMTGGAVAWSAEQHNRQLHDGKNGTKNEIGKLEQLAEDLAKDPKLQEETGISGTKDEILNKLKLAAFEIIKYGDEIKADKLYYYATKEMQSVGKAVDKGAIDYLERFQKEGYFTYDEKNAEVDKYAATGRFSDKYYETVGYDDFGRPMVILTAEGRALEEAYAKEKQGGYFDLAKGHKTAAPVISMIAKMAKENLPWENDLLPAKALETPYGTLWELNFEGKNSDPKKPTFSKADYDRYIRWQVYDNFLSEESPKILGGLITLTDFSAKGVYLDTSVSSYGWLEARKLDANGQPWLALAARMNAAPQAGLELAAQNVDWVLAADGVVGLGQLIKAGGKATANAINKQLTSSVDNAVKGAFELTSSIDSTVGNAQSIVKNGLNLAEDAAKGVSGATGSVTNTGYRVIETQYAQSTLETGAFYRSGAAGRIGNDGIYINNTIEGAVKEFQFHNPNTPFTIFEVKYPAGSSLEIANPPSFLIDQPLPFTGDVNILTAPSLRAPGTTNLLIREGAVPVRIIDIPPPKITIPPAGG